MNEPDEKDQKLPDYLCPFFEHECPLGESTAEICWMRWHALHEGAPDLEEYRVDCVIASWMFSSGGVPLK